MENNTIIAFIDDSKYSEIVCEYAAWLALESKSKIKVYHVIDTATALDTWQDKQQETNQTGADAGNMKVPARAIL